MKTKRHFWKFGLITGSLLFSSIVELVKLIFGSGSISLDSIEGQKLLESSSYRRNYELLNYYFTAQNKFNYCGVASAAIVLNALSTTTSTGFEKNDSSAITQHDVFENKIKPVILFGSVFLGMTLEQLEKLFKAYCVNAKAYYAKFITINEFRNLAKLSLNQSDTFVVVNYSRTWAGLSGHISPLVAYSLAEDSFLILDVTQKNSSVWMKTRTLYSAMNTYDLTSINFWSIKSRGFVVVTRNFDVAEM